MMISDSKLNNFWECKIIQKSFNKIWIYLPIVPYDKGFSSIYGFQNDNSNIAPNCILQDLVYQLQRFTEATATFHERAEGAMKEADGVFPIEVDLHGGMLKPQFDSREEEKSEEWNLRGLLLCFEFWHLAFWMLLDF